MIVCIITHVPHGKNGEHFYAYSPYVREMNIWLKYVDKVILVAPLVLEKKSSIHIDYGHNEIDFFDVSQINLLNIRGIFKSFVKTPKISWMIFKAMKSADHIHLRCPGNIALLGCFIQILFPKKPKTAKYAGNWDPKSKQPLTYKLQRWILSNTFLTRNMHVLVYGEWENTSKNIKPFFTATYREQDKVIVSPRVLDNRIHFLFVGTLSSGKRPIYAVHIVEKLAQLGYPVSIQFFGDGSDRSTLQHYCDENQLHSIVDFKGNQIESVVREAYKKSHFLILPSESEGWPKVVAEAMFWGCLPIATQVSCVGNMLGYGKRGLFLNMDLESDVEMIRAIIKKQTEYDSKVQESILWSRKYTLDLFENEIRALLYK